MSRVSLLFFSLVFVAAGAAAAGTAAGGKGKALGSVADSAHGSSGGGGGSTGRALNDPRKAPPLDESRKVSEQDCSKAVDPQAGNLRCK
jgi:hypothetical protein